MARIKMEFPEKHVFSTEIPLRISDINYGGHLGHDSILSLTHEARVRFFVSLGFTELDVDGPGIILSDVAIVYKSEGFYGDVIVIDIAVCDFTKYGCDLVYRVGNKETGKEVATAKTGIVFMSYAERAVAPVPEKFKSLFEPNEYPFEIQSGAASGGK
ncbi:MAG: thioesterase family protein [Candidatus Dadabacteria bacterium]|nr:thioesterase family protein [Candidatus Dadabacteria bacterium]